MQPALHKDATPLVKLPHTVMGHVLCTVLQSEVQQLRGMLADRAPVPGSLSAGSSAAAGGAGGAGGASASSAASPGVSSLEADALAWIDGLVQEVNDNIEERINLQKALFELEDINVCNQYELQNLEDMLCSTGGRSVSSWIEMFMCRYIVQLFLLCVLCNDCIRR
jgi:hypothetical protein